MQMFFPKQTADGETRFAMSPAGVKRLSKQAEIRVESGAGLGAHVADSEYVQAGATIVTSADADAAWSSADMVLTIEPPTPEQAARLKANAVLVGMLAPLKNLELIRTLAKQNVTSFSLEFVPRISRAQPMDVLSSQANIGGYKAVLMAADRCVKMMPMMITAAGTISPSKVFVLGAGVAGLQAIATAKRLGAVVEAYDVRAATKEQVQSLGARFIELPQDKQEDKSTGGYAKEQTDEQRQQQIELMAKHVAGADAVITTAAIFGKAPPLLIPHDMVTKMASGSVIVDLAADADSGRGNCEDTKPGEIITTPNGVTIVGLTNVPALVPVHASQMYANNLLAFLKEVLPEGSEVKIDFEDEIQKGACMTHGGEVKNEMLAQAMQSVQA